MTKEYNGVEVPRVGAAIEYDAPASQGKTPPFAKGAPFPRQGEQDGAPTGSTVPREKRSGSSIVPAERSTTGEFRVPDKPIIPFIEGDGTAGYLAGVAASI